MGHSVRLWPDLQFVDDGDDVKNESRLLYLTSEDVTLFVWRKDYCTEEGRYSLAEDDLSRLAADLVQSAEIPTDLVVDIIDEQYNVGTVPHVRGRDKETVAQRHAQRLFANTPYHYTQLLGREKEGRRDDKILVTAIVTPDLVKPVVDMLAKNKIALRGMFSLPVLSAALLPYLPEKATYALLVTVLRDGLRLSFFVDGKLQVSRSTPLRGGDPSEHADTLQKEVEKTQKYLGRLRLVPFGKKITVYALGGPAVISALHKRLQGGGDMVYFPVDINLLRFALKINDASPAQTCESLVAHLALRKPQPNHYAGKEQLRFHRLYGQVKGMRSVGALVSAAAIMVAVWNIINGFDYEQQRAMAQTQTAQYEQQYREIAATLPEAPVEAPLVRATVSAADKLSEMRATPNRMLLGLSTALADFPEIEIDQFKWWTVNPDEAAYGEPQQAMVTTDVQQEFFDENGNFVIRQIAEVTGQIAPFAGDYKSAMEIVERFAKALSNSRGVKRVEVKRAPISTDPKESVSGETGLNPGGEQLAIFTLRYMTENAYAP